jgi:hypothetical protein
MINAPAGILNVAAPPFSVCCALYEPLESVTVPEGGAAPLPLTVIDTASICSLVMVVNDGATVTVDATSGGAVTATETDPEEPL